MKAITGGTLIDGKGGLVRNAVVLVDGDRIAGTGAADEVPLPPGTEVLDVTKHQIAGAADFTVRLVVCDSCVGGSCHPERSEGSGGRAGRRSHPARCFATLRVTELPSSAVIDH